MGTFILFNRGYMEDLHLSNKNPWADIGMLTYM